MTQVNGIEFTAGESYTLSYTVKAYQGGKEWDKTETATMTIQEIDAAGVTFAIKAPGKDYPFTMDLQGFGFYLDGYTVKAQD